MLPVFISVIETPEDRDVIIEFFQQHKKLLYAEAYKYLSTKEDVEDTVYETIARIIDKMETFRSLAPLQRIQYAKVTVRNLSYMIQKKRSRINMVPFEDVDAYLAIDESELPDSIVLQKIQLQQMRSIWAAMPAEERLLLEQKYILRWSDEELAHRLDIKTQSVRMRLTRAKRRVIELMKEKGFLISEWLEKKPVGNAYRFFHSPDTSYTNILPFLTFHVKNNGGLNTAAAIGPLQKMSVVIFLSLGLQRHPPHPPIPHAPRPIWLRDAFP